MAESDRNVKRQRSESGHLIYETKEKTPDLPARYRDTGQPVLIGGSMGTGYYIMAGTAESEGRAWSSASHGAGRAMSRKAALKHWRGRHIIEELAGKGILIRTRSMLAYKDVDLVVEATGYAGLARRVALMLPKVCIKKG